MLKKLEWMCDTIMKKSFADAALLLSLMGFYPFFVFLPFALRKRTFLYLSLFVKERCHFLLRLLIQDRHHALTKMISPKTLDWSVTCLSLSVRILNIILTWCIRQNRNNKTVIVKKSLIS